MKFYNGILLLLFMMSPIMTYPPVTEEQRCHSLKGFSNLADHKSKCELKTMWGTLSSFHLDISNSTAKEIEDAFSEVEEITGITIVSSFSNITAIKFPALQKVKDLKLHLFNNHRLLSVEFPSIQPATFNLGKIFVHGNKILTKETLDFLNGLPKFSIATIYDIQDYGECHSSKEDASEFAVIHPGNWTQFKKCKYHVSDFVVSQDVTDKHALEFDGVFKNVTGCVLINSTTLTNLKFLDSFDRFCLSSATRTSVISNNDRLCLSEDFEGKTGEEGHKGNRNNRCRNQCSMVSNGTLVPHNDSSLPCKEVFGSLTLNKDSTGKNDFSEIEYIHGSLEIVGSREKDLYFANLRKVGSSCNDSFVIEDNDELLSLAMPRFLQMGAVLGSVNSSCRPHLSIKGNGYKVPETHRNSWEKTHSYADLDIEYAKIEEVDNSGWYSFLGVIGLLVFVFVMGVVYRSYRRLFLLKVSVKPKPLVLAEKDRTPEDAKEQLALWTRYIIQMQLLAWRSFEATKKGLHCCQYQVLRMLGHEQINDKLRRWEKLEKTHKKLLKTIPPVSVMPSHLVWPSREQLAERFDIYRRLAIQDEDVIVLMTDQQFPTGTKDNALSLLPFRLRDEAKRNKHALPKKITMVVKDTEGTVLHSKQGAVLRNMISFQYLGSHPTDDSRKCRKIEIRVKTNLYDHEKKEMVARSRTMYVLTWIDFPWKVAPVSQDSIGKFLGVVKQLWGHKLRVWVMSGNAQSFHINLQMLIWTVMKKGHHVVNDVPIPMETMVDLAHVLSTEEDAGFNPNLLSFTFKSIVDYAKQFKAVTFFDKEHKDMLFFLAVAAKVGLVSRHLRFGTLYIEDLGLSAESKLRLKQSQHSELMMSFVRHTQMRGNLPVMRFPMNFWIAHMRWPVGGIPISRLIRVEHIDYNRDYSVKWVSITRRLKESRPLTVREADYILATSRAYIAEEIAKAKTKAQLPVPEVKPMPAEAPQATIVTIEAPPAQVEAVTQSEFSLVSAKSPQKEEAALKMEKRSGSAKPKKTSAKSQPKKKSGKDQKKKSVSNKAKKEVDLEKGLGAGVKKNGKPSAQMTMCMVVDETQRD